MWVDADLIFLDMGLRLEQVASAHLGAHVILSAGGCHCLIVSLAYNVCMYVCMYVDLKFMYVCMCVMYVCVCRACG
jgi:hypothetical protein